jgi:hypothetical protein
MDDNDRLFQVTEEGRFQRLVVKAIVGGVLGFIGIVTLSGYGCNKQDDIAKIESAKADVAKAQSVNEVEKAKAEVERARLELERSILEHSSAPRSP